MSTVTLALPVSGKLELTKKEERQVVLASTLGTLFEWYDFFIYGSLAVFMSAVLFPSDNPTAALLAALGALAIGFIIRPLGGLLFGYLGDRLGRKVTFLVTVVMMGGSTVLMGCLPSYEYAGHASWILLLILRMTQGLAVGGEYGGAVVYLSEHCKPKRRGLLTSWLQMTCLGGLLLCLLVVLSTQALMSQEDFRHWGWRIPFLSSIALLVVSVYIRAKLHESPVFARMKAQGQLAKNPAAEAFTNWSSLKYVLLALFTVNAATASSFYAGQFYVMIFMQQAVALEQSVVYKLIIGGFLIGLPTYVLLGWLSDRIGRKWIMVLGAVLTALCFRPLFGELIEAGNPKLAQAQLANPVVVHAAVDEGVCNFSFSASFMGGHADNQKPCVQAKKYLVSRGVSFHYGAPVPEHVLAVSVGGKTINGFDVEAYAAALASAGYPLKADPAQVDNARVLLVLVALTLIAALTYVPVAAYMVELFPPRIRYTAISVPYHIGAGLFGGALPFIATYLTVSSGNSLAGMWYPVIVCSVAAVLGTFLLPSRPETNYESS